MANNPPTYFQFPHPTLRHLQLPNPTRFPHKGKPGFSTVLRPVERSRHGKSLIAQIQSVESAFAEEQQQRESEALPTREGLLLQFDSAPGYPLATEAIHALTTGRHSDITLLNARNLRLPSGETFTRVVLHAAFGSLKILAEKFNRYAEGTTSKGNVRQPWAANIDRISKGAFAALWTEDEDLPSADEVRWWQLWIRRFPKENLSKVLGQAQSLGVRTKHEPPLFLPEHVIILVQARRSQLENAIDLLDCLAEIRKAPPIHLELSDLSGQEQAEWIDLALGRMVRPSANAPAVCILDTGINRGHPLLQPVLDQVDNQTIFADGDASDSHHGTGHGTLMAGLAAYSDLRNLMLSPGTWEQKHRLEGVRMLDPNRPHEPENYGSVTVQAVSRPEITSQRKRVYSLAVTTTPGDGRPSSWSAALDSLAFGSEEEVPVKRLFVVSAGNTNSMEPAFAYPGDCHRSRVQDPAQAWNALTVGAITYRAHVHETDPESRLLQPMARAGGLSPHSSTGREWNPHWPVKPEIVMEGGNLGIHPTEGPTSRDSLDLLSTSAQFSHRPIVPFCATSAATALAARLGAQIQAEYPELWPESIRAVIVNSADWHPTMLDGVDPHRADGGSREGLGTVLRTFGFGEPKDLRSLFSSQQQVTLISQETITPYKGGKGNASLNDCHVHELKLPRERLLGLANATARLKITLSYFTAPNPSASNSLPGSRYRYGGALLRFRVRHKDEDEETFLAHVAQQAEDDDQGENEEVNPSNKPKSLHDPAWALGSKFRGKSGSLVHDIWQGNAADLATMDRIAVYPVKGWWAAKSMPEGSPWQDCHGMPLRYSLVVSLEVHANVPLYTEIQNLLSVPVSAT